MSPRNATPACHPTFTATRASTFDRPSRTCVLASPGRSKTEPHIVKPTKHKRKNTPEPLLPPPPHPRTHPRTTHANLSRPPPLPGPTSTPLPLRQGHPPAGLPGPPLRGGPSGVAQHHRPSAAAPRVETAHPQAPPHHPPPRGSAAGQHRPGADTAAAPASPPHHAKNAGRHAPQRKCVFQLPSRPSAAHRNRTTA